MFLCKTLSHVTATACRSTRTYFPLSTVVISLLKFHQLQADTSKLLHRSPRRVRDAYGSATVSFYLEAKLHNSLFFFPTEHDTARVLKSAGIRVTSTRLYTALPPRKNSWLSVNHPHKLYHSYFMQYLLILHSPRMEWFCKRLNIHVSI